MPLKPRAEDQLWKERSKFFFITITSGLLYLTMFVTSEPVCYTRESPDELNTNVKMVDCDGNDKICKRFASREEVNLFEMLTITCKAGDVPTINAGFFNCSGYTVGDKCNLTCDDGYYPSSSREIVCQEHVGFEGNWSAGTFQCSAIICQAVDLPTVNNGYFNCSGFSVGDKCNLTCDDGYYRFSSKETVCEENEGVEGNWSVGTFQCKVIVCNNWNEWNDTEYKFISTKQRWEKCRQLCVNGSGHLVTIENEEENDFVHKVLLQCMESGPVWIGLKGNFTRGALRWIDGSILTYTNWDEDALLEGEKCTRMRRGDGKWQIRLCYTDCHTVCERKIPTE